VRLLLVSPRCSMKDPTASLRLAVESDKGEKERANVEQSEW
jgi:hypothetical protein